MKVSLFSTQNSIYDDGDFPYHPVVYIVDGYVTWRFFYV
jgi:hypothetical protein